MTTTMSRPCSYSEQATPGPEISADQERFAGGPVSRRRPRHHRFSCVWHPSPDRAVTRTTRPRQQRHESTVRGFRTLILGIILIFWRSSAGSLFRVSALLPLPMFGRPHQLSITAFLQGRKVRGAGCSCTTGIVTLATGPGLCVISSLLHHAE